MELSSQLPVTAERVPGSVDELVELLVDAHRQGTPVYPVGGGTSLDYGRSATRPGLAVRMTELNRVVDYPARDMTITVQAGITMARLSEVLAAEGQQLPVDVPQADRATLGGVLATNWNGPRRLGHGGLRDYVIGIRAVDGRGERFAGGGRVVKNVAGYDFCKLLTGSLGTLGIVHEVTLKVKPLAPATALVICAPDSHHHADQILTALALGPLPSVAIEWLNGAQWRQCEPWCRFEDPIAEDTGLLAVGFEGSAAEMDWLIQELRSEWMGLGIERPMVWRDESARGAWSTLVEFPVHADPAITLRSVGVPSGVAEMVAAARRVDPDCWQLAHAGSGEVLTRLSRVPASGLGRALTGELGMVASRAAGYVQILSNPDRVDSTLRTVWGGADLPRQLLWDIKQQFDPRNILNPGRFVYHEPSPVESN